MKTKVVAKAVLMRPDGQVLLLRRSADDDINPGEWDFPGGGVDEGEEIAQGTAREIAEEAGLDVKPSSLTLVYGDAGIDRGKNKVWLYYLGHTDTDDVTLSHEHDKYIWLDLAEAVETADNAGQKQVLKHIYDHQLFDGLS